jgi:hypothetical protein
MRWELASGERVAMVSHNAARLLTAFFGVSGWPNSGTDQFPLGR